jgi:hypothetical protein
VTPQLKNWPLVGFSGGGLNGSSGKLHEYADTGLFFLPSILASFLADHLVVATARVDCSAFNASKAAPLRRELALSVMVYFAYRSLNNA